MQKAIIYCRVSSERQVNEGHGLDSQERLCLNYAKNMNYKVLKIFKEEGVSGGLFERPTMKRLLHFLDEYKFGNEDEKIIVIFDDLKRFARDIQVHFQLKKEIYGRRGIVESPNFKFEDTPEGKFVETVLAGAAELERNQNTRQVKSRMKARLETGYWCFRSAPKGLRYTKHPLHGKILMREEPYATIYKEAIESFRDGLLNTIEQVQEFINKKYKKH